MKHPAVEVEEARTAGELAHEFELPLAIEHEGADDQLPTALEQIRQAGLAVVALKAESFSIAAAGGRR